MIERLIQAFMIDIALAMDMCEIYTGDTSQLFFFLNSVFCPQSPV